MSRDEPAMNPRQQAAWPGHVERATRAAGDLEPFSRAWMFAWRADGQWVDASQLSERHVAVITMGPDGAGSVFVGRVEPILDDAKAGA